MTINPPEQFFPKSKILDRLPCEVYLIDCESLRILYANDQACRNLQYSLEELVQLFPWQITAQGCREAILRNKEWLERHPGQQISKVIRRLRRDGTTYELEISVALEEVDGRVCQLTTGTDITERRAYEARLQQGQQQLAEAQALAHLGSWEWDVVRDEVVGSAEFYRIFGRPSDALAPLGDFLAMVHPEDQHRVRACIDQELSSREPYCYHYRVCHPERGVRALEVRAKTVCDEAGNVVRLLGTCQDVTDITEIRQALDESQSRLKSILESVADVIWSVEPVMLDVTYLNAAAVAVYGRSVADLTGKHTLWTDVVHPDDQLRVSTFLMQVKALGEHVMEYRIVRPDGEVRWVCDRGRAVRDDTGRLLRLDGIIADITARKQATEESERWQALLNDIVDRIPSGLSVKDGVDQRYLIWNRAAEEIAGIPRDQVLDRRDCEFLPKDEAVNCVAQDEAVLLTGQPLADGKTIARGSECRQLHVRKFPLFDERGATRYVATIWDDVTERNRFADALRASEESFRAIFELAEVGISMTAPDGSMPVVNRKFCEILGYSAEELAQLTFHAVTHPVDLPGNLREMESLLNGDIDSYSMEKRYIRKDGSSVWTCLTVSLRRDPATGAPQHFISVIHDISARKEAERQLEESQQRYKSLFEHHPDAIYSFDLSGNFLAGNPALENIIGYSVDELLHRSFLPLVTAECREVALHHFRLAAQGKPQNFETVAIHKRGHRIELSVTNLPIVINDQIVGVYGIAQDISERNENQRRLARLVQYDELTGLPNRHLFQDRLNQALKRADLKQNAMALFYLDLDKFKEVNDTLGHEAGDRVLRMTAERLVGCVRKADTVSRLGGDEFTVILEHLADESNAALIAEKVQAAISEPFEVDGVQFFLTTSIGIATYAQGSNQCDAEELVRRADLAMYQAKELGRNCFQSYSDDINQRMVQRLALKRQLHLALERGEFCLDYQPVVALDSGRIVGVEALVRWHRPEHGMVAPDDFIPVAEESGMIVAIGEWVLRTACDQNKRWQCAGLPRVALSVNISIRQLREPGFTDMVRRCLMDSGLEAQYLNLELTESMLMENIDETRRALGDLQAIGVQFSIDDFGTGYSSLSYLKHLPIQTIKLDRSFVANITSEPDEAAIVMAVIGMAHGMKMKVVAEGVESAGQLDFLRMQQCDQIQGYYFSPPIDTAAMEHLLRQRRNLSLDNGQAHSPERTLLVVDDEPNITASLRRLLRTDQYRILTAHSALEGFELLATNQVGVIISDQRMPQMSGTEFLSRVKELYPETVRMVLSGYTDLSSVTDAINHGAVYKFLTKPWENDQLREVVREAFQRYRKTQESMSENKGRAHWYEPLEGRTDPQEAPQSRPEVTPPARNGGDANG